ncbi:MAG: hypothetical protein A2014_05435 [Spirochaetes bacterium GWF1_49_6]|nr:MAG: hypothetical protein A2014_05435 [Spirochaetes bacterium GWF1_49_6]
MTRTGTAVYYSIIFFLIGFSPLFAKVNVGSVHIVINNEFEYVWTNKNTLPEKIPGCLTDPYTVITLISFSPGKFYNDHILKWQILRTVSRLTASKYYSSVEANILPDETDPETSHILIYLTEAKQVRIGGGLAYGSLILNNLAGKPFDLRIDLGYNRIGAEFKMKYLAFAPFHITLSAYYKNNGITPSPVANYHLYDLNARFGLEFPIDWIAGFDINLHHIIHPSVNHAIPAGFIGAMERTEMVLSPYIQYSFSDGKDPIRSGGYLLLRMKAFLPIERDETLFSFQGVLAIKRILTGWKHSVNFQISGGGATGLLPYKEKFDLKGTLDLSVRSPQEYYRYFAENYALFNFEYRIRIVEFFLPPVFATQLDAFVFTDIGISSPYGHALFENNTLMDAYGFGLRVSLDDPFAVNGTFCFGWNRFGECRVVLWGTSGF